MTGLPRLDAEPRLFVPWGTGYFAGSNFSDTPFMQYRWPVGGGPSGKTWPRWPSQRAQRTSVRTMPWERSWYSLTASPEMGLVNDGQPVPDSNFSPDLKSGLPHAAQT